MSSSLFSIDASLGEKFNNSLLILSILSLSEMFSVPSFVIYFSLFSIFNSLSGTSILFFFLHAAILSSFFSSSLFSGTLFTLLPG